MIPLVGDVAREQLRVALEQIIEANTTAGMFTSNEGVARSIAEIIRTSWQGASDGELDEIAEVYRRAFNVSLPDDAAPSIAQRVDQRPFESLIPRDGWFGRYLEYTRDSEPPGQYHFASALVAIASSLGRRPRVEWEARTIYPNLYALLVGPSGARKSAAMDKAVKLVRNAVGVNVLPTEGTHQGFAAALRRRHQQTEMWSDGLIVAPEFRVLVSCDKQKSELHVWLTDWYDCPDVWERGLRGDASYILRNVCVSMLGGSNMALLRGVPEEAVTGGFFPRMLLFVADDKRFWRARPKFNTALAQELTLRLQRQLLAVPETIGFAREAGDYLDKWYEVGVRADYERYANDERMQAWLARKQAAVMKIAAVMQIIDGEQCDVVELPFVEVARSIVDWTDVDVAKVYGTLGVTVAGGPTDDVLDAIRRASGRMPQRSLVRALQGRWNLSQIKSGLATLEAGGVVKREHSATEGTVWRLRVGALVVDDNGASS